MRTPARKLEILFWFATLSPEGADEDGVDGSGVFHTVTGEPMAGSATFEREKLYDEIWTDPVSTVSKRHGLADHTLRKICKELGVPTPPGGYWSALRLGKTKPERAALPPFTGPSVFEYIGPEIGIRPFPQHGQGVACRNVELEESNPDNQIVVATDGGFRDPFVKAVAKYLADADKQLEARKRPGWRSSGVPQLVFVHTSPSHCIDPGYDHLRIIVSKELRPRALYVADAFICAVKDRGFKVKLRDRTVVIEARDLSMRIRLTEAERKE
ncbi:hypothetical protein P0D80_48930, partial [Paraburkholderia sp. RL17-373-BIF-A]